MINDLPQAQSDMRTGYCSGGAGVLASSLAWFAAAIATIKASPQQAVWVLFIGGMAIHPVAILICKLFGRSGKHAKTNPLGALAAASVFWLIFSLPLAYVVSLYRIEWFFPAMLLVIGGRYLTFSTLFGLRVYWVLGMALAGTGYLLGKFAVTPTLGAFAGASVEALFAVYILIADRRAATLTPAGAHAAESA
ncbi:DUF7010 family protein [Tahibacter amnicola]|uniref:Uncharacterized protein n=1 Tax=Tahibacter amnicola TaxID=2976241 RepID=A0ABY6BLE5_9GAMM|nr:hypothetical protein [Tahibacter amnicola]UXI70297.1 hypothetical protein N4264_11870 [Tahibacter amnicola]